MERSIATHGLSLARRTCGESWAFTHLARLRGALDGFLEVAGETAVAFHKGPVTASRNILKKKRKKKEIEKSKREFSFIYILNYFF